VILQTLSFMSFVILSDLDLLKVYLQLVLIVVVHASFRFDWPFDVPLDVSHSSNIEVPVHFGEQISQHHLIPLWQFFAFSIVFPFDGYYSTQIDRNLPVVGC
tara:strand:- start:1197 stop:1502 length:306 start_codon:yes stop_codon:yes gene_type:complete